MVRKRYPRSYQSRSYRRRRRPIKANPSSILRTMLRNAGAIEKGIKSLQKASVQAERAGVSWDQIGDWLGEAMDGIRNSIGEIELAQDDLR